MEKPNFPSSFWQGLATHNPLGHKDITEQDARDWFDLIWPVYQQNRSRVRVPNHKLRIANWWIRITKAEIEKARARGAELRRSNAADRLTELAAQVFPQQAPPLRRDLPPLKIVRGGEHG